MAGNKARQKRKKSNTKAPPLEGRGASRLLGALGNDKLLRLTEKLNKDESRKGLSLFDFSDYSKYKDLADGVTIDYAFVSPVPVVQFYRTKGASREFIPKEELDRTILTQKLKDSSDAILVKAINRLRLDRGTPACSLTNEQLQVGRMTKQEWSRCCSFRALQQGSKVAPCATESSGLRKEGQTPKASRIAAVGKDAEMRPTGQRAETTKQVTSEKK
jgi:hypothetical protein